MIKPSHLMVLSLSLLLSGCYEPPILDEIPALKEKYKDYFLIGSMIQDEDITLASHVVEKHCSIVTVNRFYWNYIHPEAGVYHFEPGDRHIEYALEKGLKVRGHPLIFGTVDPDWVFKDGDQEISRSMLIQRMQDHIQTIVTRYKGKIDYWDVVNEPTADFYFNLNADPSSIFDVYKDHSWYSIIGEEYIELALQFAHEADPEAKLFVNENNIIGYLSGIKKNNFIKIIQKLIETGAPLHGVGIQGHWAYDYPPFDKIGETVELFSAMGLEVHITELDLSTYSIVRWFLPDLIPVHDSYHELIEQLQTQRYYNLFKELRTYSHDLAAAVFWGLSDPTSWLLAHPDERDDWPLLFDDHYNPKKAFWAAVDF